MNALLRLSLVLLLALSATVARAEFRDFTDIKGQTKRFQLVSHDGSGKTVDLRTREGRVIKGAALASFSEPDQEYIRGWMKETPPTVDYNFRIDAKREKVDSQGGSSNKTTEYVFKLRVVNAARTPVSALTLRYQIHTSTKSSSSFGGDSKKVSVSPGEVAITGPLRPSGLAEIETEPLAVSQSESSGFGGFVKMENKSSVDGILVRLYDSHGQVAGEYKSEGMASREWDEELNEKQGQRDPLDDAEDFLKDLRKMRDAPEENPEQPAEPAKAEVTGPGE